VSNQQKLNYLQTMKRSLFNCTECSPTKKIENTVF